MPQPLVGLRVVEFTQTLGELAYMTVWPCDPVRAGTSGNDIMIGMFGAVGVLGALIQRNVFCSVPGLTDLLANPELATNNQRVQARPGLQKILQQRLAHRTVAELAVLMESAGLPFAPIRKPEELLSDEHLLATGGLADVELPDGAHAGQTVKTPLLPITLQGQRLGVRMSPPRLGEHSQEVLLGLGLSLAEIVDFRERRIVA